MASMRFEQVQRFILAKKSILELGALYLLCAFASNARFKRRILHVPNLMQMRENNRFLPFALDSADVKCDV